MILNFMSFSLLPSYAQAHGSSCDAIYQFGDSISDTGNIIHEPIGAYLPFGRFPYGMSALGGTGRCSNGLLMIDFIAEALSLPYLKPYLGGDFSNRTGLNFAVAGSTALDTATLALHQIVQPITSSSFAVQVEWFKTYLKGICSSQADCAEKIKNALFVIETGGNDINYALLERHSLEDVRENLLPGVVKTIISTAKDLMDMGANRVVVAGNFPIGCLPIYLTTFATGNTKAYDEINCLKDFNYFARVQNALIQRRLQKLRGQYPEAVILYADYYNALETIIRDAPTKGFGKESLLKACCGAGGEYNFNLLHMCGMDGASVCSNPNQYLSWDGIHQTEKSYSYMAAWLLKSLGLKSICNSQQ